VRWRRRQSKGQRQEQRQNKGQEQGLRQGQGQSAGAGPEAEEGIPMLDLAGVLPLLR